MSQDLNLESTETKRRGMGKARVKPRHLSQIVRQAIIDQFHARQSSEDVAEELGLPVRTVTDVLLLHELRRSVQSAGRPELVRRIA
jgi:hypothetical protein